MGGKAKRRGCSEWTVLQLVLASAFLLPAQAVIEVQNSVGSPPARLAPRHHHGTNLDDRVRILSQWLALDETQRSKLRKVLEGQREQVKSVWNDTSVPAAYRVSATQAISDKTADQIRALLNEEQRKKFNPPRVPHEAAAGYSKPSVEDWMDTTRSR